MTNNRSWHVLNSKKYDLKQYSTQNLLQPTLNWEFDYILFEIKMLLMEPG